MARYFDHLTIKTAMERHTLFVQTTPDLFQNDSLCSMSSALKHTANEALPVSCTSETLDRSHRCASSHAISGTDIQMCSNKVASKTCPLSEIYIRRERQTFRRLSTSDSILFTVRTFMTPLTSLGNDELTAFIEQAKGWGAEMAAYKGRQQWWNTVLQYQEDRKRGLAERH